MSETEEDTVEYSYEGNIADHDYDGDFQVSVYSCSVCAALVSDLGQVRHTKFHLSVKP
jgi:hypothetical protein